MRSGSEAQTDDRLISIPSSFPLNIVDFIFEAHVLSTLTSWRIAQNTSKKLLWIGERRSIFNMKETEKIKPLLLPDPGDGMCFAVFYTVSSYSIWS